MKLLVRGMLLLILMVSPLAAATLTGDINSDGKIALEEAIYALQCVAGLKTGLPTQEEIEELEEVVNYAAAAASDSLDTVSANEIISYLGLSEVSGESALAVALALKNGSFECGTMALNGTTVTYTFNEGNDCGVTGSVSVTPVVSQGSVLFSIVYNDVVQGECAINGSGTTAVQKDGENIIIGHQSDDLSVCGQQMDGTTTVAYNSGTFVSATVAGVYSYFEGQTEITAEVDLVYDGTTLNGSATITIDGQQPYDCEFSDVVIDPECGIPTAGTITIDGTTFDFSQTTCENPSVITTIHGIPVTVDLDEAMAMGQGF